MSIHRVLSRSLSAQEVSAVSVAQQFVGYIGQITPGKSPFSEDDRKEFSSVAREALMAVVVSCENGPSSRRVLGNLLRSAIRSIEGDPRARSASLILRQVLVDDREYRTTALGAFSAMRGKGGCGGCGEKKTEAEGATAKVVNRQGSSAANGVDQVEPRSRVIDSSNPA